MASSLTLDLADQEPRSAVTRSSATDHSEGHAASHTEREVTVPAHVNKHSLSEDDESCDIKGKGKGTGKGKGKKAQKTEFATKADFLSLQKQLADMSSILKTLQQAKSVPSSSQLVDDDDDQNCHQDNDDDMYNDDMEDQLAQLEATAKVVQLKGPRIMKGFLHVFLIF